MDGDPDRPRLATLSVLPTTEDRRRRDSADRWNYGLWSRAADHRPDYSHSQPTPRGHTDGIHATPRRGSRPWRLSVWENYVLCRRVRRHVGRIPARVPRGPALHRLRGHVSVIYDPTPIPMGSTGSRSPTRRQGRLLATEQQRAPPAGSATTTTSRVRVRWARVRYSDNLGETCDNILGGRASRAADHDHRNTNRQSCSDRRRPRMRPRARRNDKNARLVPPRTCVGVAQPILPVDRMSAAIRVSDDLVLLFFRKRGGGTWVHRGV